MQIGDNVHYKRKIDSKWKGPGKIIGKDGSLLFIRQGGELIRIHTCDIHPVNEREKLDERKNGDKNANQENVNEPLISNRHDLEDVETVESEKFRFM